MSDNVDLLASQLRALLDRWGFAVARQAFGQQAAMASTERHQRLAVLVFGRGNPPAGQSPAVPATGVANISGTQRRNAVGVNFGTIQAFFGAQPPADAKELLDNYLESLIAEHAHLRL